VFGALPPALRRTLTWDQGNEMFHHQRVEQQTGVKIYFADAHSPWQRGTNENTNGLLRQYFPRAPTLDSSATNGCARSPTNSTTVPANASATGHHSNSWHDGAIT
jgi:IS30 family transposase